MSKNQLALFEDELASMAVATLKEERSSVSTAFLSTKGGNLTYRDNPVAGNKMQCVILAAPIERLFYSSRYDPTKIVGPDCYAIDASAIGLKPFDNVPNKQHVTCEGCPKNEWGSSPTGGKGKACRETRRLLLLPADAVTSANAVSTAELAALRPPVTSIKNYATYIQTIAATLRRPPLGVITEIAVVPDAKTQFKVTFNMVSTITDTAVLQALVARSKEELAKTIDAAGAGNVDEEDTCHI